MTTSNSTNFALNAQAALRLARVLGIGQSVDAGSVNIGANPPDGGLTGFIDNFVVRKVI